MYLKGKLHILKQTFKRLHLFMNQCEHVHAQTAVPCAKAQEGERWLVKMCQQKKKSFYRLENIGMLSM